MYSFEDDWATFKDSLDETASNLHSTLVEQMSRPNKKKFTESLLRIDAMREFMEMAQYELKDMSIFLERLQEECEICIENADEGQLAINFDKEASWADEVIREENLNNYKKKLTRKGGSRKMRKPINIYKNINLGSEMELPVVNDFADMEPCIYYKKGEDAGVYVCIDENFYVEVPFSDVNSSNVPVRIDRCEHNNLEDCRKKTEVKKNSFMDRLANSGVRKECTKVHSGENYTRVGHVDRCPRIARLGAHSTLKKDINEAGAEDIKFLLMHALNDLFLASLWHQKRRDKLLFKNINKVT
jgi:hypothetical protein